MTTPAAQTSLYTPLRAREIRLVNIHQQADGVSCDLEVANLDEQPQYVALSYTWGPSTPAEADALGFTNVPSHEIRSNGLPVLITENLYNFMARASKSPGMAKKRLWIDNLCINQGDEAERTNQVKMMASIYHCAEQLYIWLGEEDEDTERAIGLMKCLARLDDDQLKHVEPSALNTPLVLDLLSPCGTPAHWDSIRTFFFNRSYFSRIWVIQELILARERTMMCGSHTISWADVVKVSHLFTVTRWTRWISPSGRLTNSHHTVPNLVEANRRTREKKTPELLLYSLIRTRRFAASDPLDKVYGLLGLMDEATRSKPRLEPVYRNRSVVETYTLSTIQILEDSNDLLVLAHAEGERFRVTSGIPSWVPDWQCPRVTGLGVTGYTRYNACGSLPRSLRIDEDTKSLYVKGIKLDRITALAETKAEMLAPQPFPRLLSMISTLPPIYHTGQPLLEVLWRVLLTDTAGVPPAHPAPHAYGRPFEDWFSFRINYMRERGDTPMSLIESACNSLGAPLKWTEPLEIEHRDDADGNNEEQTRIHVTEYEAAFSHSPNLRLFSTYRSYLGVCSESAIADDEVWILAGSRVPLVLRSISSSRYAVVGGAYLHGFMHGEGLKFGSFAEIVLV